MLLVASSCQSISTTNVLLSQSIFYLNWFISRFSTGNISFGALEQFLNFAWFLKKFSVFCCCFLFACLIFSWCHSFDFSVASKLIIFSYDFFLSRTFSFSILIFCIYFYNKSICFCDISFIVSSNIFSNQKFKKSKILYLTSFQSLYIVSNKSAVINL